MKLTLKKKENKEFNLEKSVTKDVIISYDQVERELVNLTQKEHELDQQIASATEALATVKENIKEFAALKKEMDRLLK